MDVGELLDDGHTGERRRRCDARIDADGRLGDEKLHILGRDSHVGGEALLIQKLVKRGEVSVDHGDIGDMRHGLGGGRC